MIYGAIRSDRAEELLARLRSLIWPVVHVLPFDQEAAEIYGRVRVDLERRGVPLPEADLRIAAVALSRQMILVTGNVRHFNRIANLTVENWL